MAEYDPVIRTRTLARICGPYLMIAAATIAARYDTLPMLLPAYVGDASLVLATGAFTLMAGLAMLAAHHHWSSPPAIAITVLAILVTLRGAALMLIPYVATRYAGIVVDAPLIALIAAAALFVLGMWLTFVGWIAKFARTHAP